MKKVYLAGKITGYDDYLETFQKYENKLQANGFIVLNPAKMSQAIPNLGYEDYMQICFSMIDVADKVAFMPNWKDSDGAKREMDYATKNQKSIIELDDPEAKPAKNRPKTRKTSRRKENNFSKSNFYTQDEYQKAMSQNIVSYLQSMGYELTKESSSYYRGKLHDSLVINSDTGAWTWNSRDVADYSPVQLLKQILIHDYNYLEKDAYISAVKRLAGTEGENYIPNTNNAPKQKTEPIPIEKKTLVLPPTYKNHNRVIAYLCQTRGIDYDIVKEMILDKKLYETNNHHNACFVSYDASGKPKHGFLRGTLTNPERPFAGDVENSDKSYGFMATENKDSTKVFCFESAIDALSHATLYKLDGHDHQNETRMSLHSTSFLALEKYLNDNPQVKEIVSCFDNDKTGNRRSKTMYDEFSERGYKVSRQLPKEKDFNDDLVNHLNTEKELEMSTDMAMEMEM